MLFGAVIASGQSIATLHDTVTITVSTDMEIIPDSVVNLTSGAVTVDWRVIASDFPADWRVNTGICDMVLCYNYTGLWPLGTVQSFTFFPGADHYHLGIYFANITSAGCYYLTVKMNNQAIPTDTAMATFIVCKPYPAGVPAVKTGDEVSLYPNPAGDVVNITYNSTAGIRTIIVTDMAGRAVSSVATTGEGNDTLDMTGIATGLYIVRLVNSEGATVATKRVAMR